MGCNPNPVNLLRNLIELCLSNLKMFTDKNRYLKNRKADFYIKYELSDK